MSNARLLANLVPDGLDDYEEGTWTGTLEGSTTDPTTPVTETGTYTKIGRLVYAQIYFSNVSNQGAAGNVFVSGMPFPAAISNPANGSCTVFNFDFDGRTSLSVQISSSNLFIFASGDDAAWSNLKHTAGTGRYLTISVVYEI